MSATMDAAGIDASGPASEDPAVSVDLTESAPTQADMARFKALCTSSEGHMTETWYEQRATEGRVFDVQLRHRSLVLHRDKHVGFLLAGLRGVDGAYAALHASQPWLLYWMLHALDVLDTPPPPSVLAGAVHHLRLCRDEASGGFGGGPGQEAHLASTYAAVAALVVIGTPDAFEAIRPDDLRRFLLALKCPDGGFAISHSGEKDVRALYSAMASASMAGVLDSELTANVGAYVRSLVSFDGGIGGEPGTEAHGGNSYCGVAACVLAGVLDELDSEAIIDWAAMKQCRLEGGFCGRTNKLVDSCYSFWVGALFPILGAPKAFNADSLQRYILTCCQEPEGGLRDKPGVSCDYHHTCYALSGLSIAQHYGGAQPEDEASRVAKVDVLHNVRIDRLRAVREHFNIAS